MPRHLGLIVTRSGACWLHARRESNYFRGGKRARLLKLSREQRKPMLGVKGKPILDHVVEGVIEAAIREIFIIADQPTGDGDEPTGSGRDGRTQ
jgi:CTP:molybdopterin cytidylyltransferase MocA